MKNTFINICLLTSLPAFLIISMEDVKKKSEKGLCQKLPVCASRHMCICLCLLVCGGHTVFFSCFPPYVLKQGLTDLPALTTVSLSQNHQYHSISTTASVSQHQYHNSSTTASVPQHQYHSIRITIAVPQYQYHSISNTASVLQQQYHSISTIASVQVAHGLHGS